mgnify:CR=1 FL=1
MDDCSDHSDCGEGRKCINLYCGAEDYYEALEEMSCDSDQFCKVGADKTNLYLSFFYFAGHADWLPLLL